MIENKEQALLTLTEEAVKAATDLRSAFEENGRTVGEKMEKMQKHMEELERKLDAAPRSVTLPGMEVTSLRWKKTPEDFQRLLRSRPHGNAVEVAMVEDLQRSADNLYFTRLLADFHNGSPVSGEQIKDLRAYKEFEAVRGHLMRALDSATTGEGLEWIPTGYSAQIREKVAVQLRAAGLIPTFQMPTNPWIFPFETALPTVQKVSETTAAQTAPWDTSTGSPEAYGSGEPTGKATFTLKKHRALQVVSREFEEDSVAATMDWLKGRIAYAIARGRERTLINGATGTHIDNDLAGGASTIPEKTLNGLRKFWSGLSGATSVPAGAATPTSAMYRQARALMAEFGVDIANIAWLVSPLGMGHMMSMSQVQTLEKYGAGATIINGEIGRFDGSPVILSGIMKDNLHTTGVNASGQSNNTTQILCWHTLNWAWGEKPGMGLESVRMPVVDQTLLVMFDRFDLQYLGGASDKTIAAINNVPATITNV